MSTGIGTENIDIVMNELDALVNIDLKEKEFKKDHKALELFRMGTCGSVNPDIEVNNMLVTQNVGLDGLMHFYQDYQFENEFSKNFLRNFLRENQADALLCRLGRRISALYRMQNTKGTQQLSLDSMHHKAAS
jgi:uridine phosphorylase